MKDIILKKPKARTSILFKSDKEDDWFVDVIHFENKSGKQTSKSRIIQKDVEDWICSYQNRGWLVTDDKINTKIVESEDLKDEDQDLF